MNEISALLKGTSRKQKVLTPSLPHEDTARNQQSETQNKPLLKPNHAGALVSDFQPPDLQKINFVAYKLPVSVVTT